MAAVRAVADLEIVNGGGTGSLESTVREGVVTEVAAGSGLYAPALFDGYDAFRARPAAFFGLDVTRRPAPGVVTVSGGGWVASGPAGRDRLPVPALPEGLRLLGAEGAGEVQTPLTGAPARTARRRRPGLVPARQGRRAVRAGRGAAPGAGRRRGRDRPDLPRRGG